MWAVLTYHRKTLFCLSLLCVLHLRPVLAWPEESRPLTLTLAVERALASSPELRRSIHERQIEEGRLRQADIRPRVGLDLEVENFLGSDFYEGVGNAETTLSLIWILERGKREKRRTAAQVGLDAAAVAAQVRQVDVAADTADAFLHVLMDQQRLQLAEEAVRLGREARNAVAERVRVGRSSSIDLARAEGRSELAPSGRRGCLARTSGV